MQRRKPRHLKHIQQILKRPGQPPKGMPLIIPKRRPIDPGKADIDLQGTTVCRGGLAAPFSEGELKRKLESQECEIRFAIRGKGKGAARFWTCDLTEGYIRINASYRT